MEIIKPIICVQPVRKRNQQRRKKPQEEWGTGNKTKDKKKLDFYCKIC